jgi:predicted ferric reductase
MRALNIIGLALVFVMFIITGFYINEVSSTRWSSYLDFDYMFNSSRVAALTTEAVMIMLVFVLFYTAAYIANLIKVKTTTSKVMAIIGLSFSFIVLLTCFGVLAEPRAMSFDESGGVFIFYGIINLAFFIVHLVQSVVVLKRKTNRPSNPDIVDEIF